MRDTAPVAERLPDDIVERMRRLQEAAAVGTTPFPGVDRAVRRRRRRAAGTGAAALTLVMVAGGAVLTGAGRDRTTVTPATTPSPSASVAEPMPSPTPPGPWQNRRRPGAPVPEAPTGFGPVAGSLAGDEAWLAALRRAVATRNQADGPAQVHVLWAGEVEGQRYAVVVAPDFDRDSGHGDMSWSLWGWRVSADGRRAQPVSTGMAVDPGTDVRTISMALDVGADSLGAAVPERSAVLVLDAHARSVEIGGPPRYPATGGKERTFTPLHREGMVWPGVQTRDQLVYGILRITAADGTRRKGGMITYEGVDEPPSFAPVAPAGADPHLLACAGGGWLSAVPVGAVPLLAGTTHAGGSGWAVGVLRAREGGYLLGACRDGGFPPGNRFVVPAPAGGPDRLTALLPMDPTMDGRSQVFAVIAPADATVVELAGHEVPVRQRVAVIDLGEPRAQEGLQVTARRADGGVAGTAGVATTDGRLDGQFIDEGLPPD